MKVIIALFFCLMFVTPAQSAIRIAVDPGHGGEDDGAVANNVREAEIALNISRKLYELLRKDRKFIPFLLRTSNSEIALSDRVGQAKRSKVDIYVSVHANSSPDPKVRGAEFYIQNQMQIEEESMFLAARENSHEHGEFVEKKHDNNLDSILYDLKKTQKIIDSYKMSWFLRKNWKSKIKRKKSSMIRQAPFYVLSQSEIPAVLVEVGYLSNDKERQLLVSESYQSKLAQKIYRGLADYAKNMDKPLPTSLKQ